METPSKIKSRWSRESRLKKGEKRIITPRDIEGFKLLYRYRYLQINDICAFVGGSEEIVRKRWGDFSAAPFFYVNRPHQQRERANANYAPMIYELDTAGYTLLRELGLPMKPKVYHRNFAHELMVNRVMFSIELGIRADPDAQLITWPEILAAGNLPRRTREAEHPNHIPYEFRTKAGVEGATIAADHYPFGIRFSGKYLFFPGIEADCGTEPLSTADYERSSIQRKFLAYLDILENKTYASHFDFPTFYVPFFFPTIARKESAMTLLERMTPNKPELRRFFLFKTYPTLTSFGKQAPATGHIYTEPFTRVGMAPFTIAQTK